MAVFTFLSEFVRDPIQLGAVAPSGPALASAMVEAADLRAGQVIVELGAGTGPMTEAILAKRPDGPFVALEPNAALAALLRQRFPGVDVDERLAQALPTILAERGHAHADRVVSSLPWAIWPEALQNDIFDSIQAVLARDGRMVTFGYVHAQPLPAARRLRAQLDARFNRVSVTPVTWWNLPPARVFVCEGPKPVG